MDQKHVYGFAKWQAPEGKPAAVLILFEEVDSHEVILASQPDRLTTINGRDRNHL